MKKLILLILFIALLAAAFYGYKEYQRKTPDTNSLKTDFKLSANELYDAFDSDETSASEKFTEKVLEVNGTIDAIEIEDSVVSIILLADNAMIGGINCQINPNQDISNLENGQNITIKGVCQGFLMNVIINRGILIDEK